MWCCFHFHRPARPPAGLRLRSLDAPLVASASPPRPPAGAAHTLPTPAADSAAAPPGFSFSAFSLLDTLPAVPPLWNRFLMSGRGRGGEAMPRPDRRSAQKAKEKITIAVKHMERETRKATRERNKIKKKTVSIRERQSPSEATQRRKNGILGCARRGVLWARAAPEQ